MHITIQKKPVVVSLAIFAALVVFLAGVLAGRSLVAAPVSHPADVPADALAIAQQAGAEIIELRTPDELTLELYTSRFPEGYSRIYDVLSLRGARTPRWIGTPVVTLAGDGYLDVVLAAETSAGIDVIDLRLVRENGVWKVSHLNTLQTREVAK